VHGLIVNATSVHVELVQFSCDYVGSSTVLNIQNL